MAITQTAISAWTDDALDVLMRHYPSEGYKGVQRNLNKKKSKQAIIAKARRLGLSSSAPRGLHGMVGTRTYRAWAEAKQRAFNEKHAHHNLYRGKGMCKEWANSFESFLADMGAAPTEKHQIDRIDSDKGYTPGNCRWATAQQNAANTRKNNATGYRGVNRLPSGRYRAIIRVGGARIDLGVFDSPIEAAIAYDHEAIRYFGEYAMTNARMGSIQDKA